MMRSEYIRSLLAGAVLAAAISVAVSVTAQPGSGQGIGLVFKVDGRPVTLADDVRLALIEQADKIVRNCAYDAGDREERVWRQALAEPSSIRLIYAAPVRLRRLRREVLASEAVLSLGDPNFIGSPVLHDAGSTTLVFKCDGTDMIRLMCMPGLKAHFPPGYQRNCHILRRF